MFLHTWTSHLSLSFCSLNHPSSLSLSSSVRRTSPLAIFLSFHWTQSIMSMSLLHWWAQNWTQHSRCVSPARSSGEGSAFATRTHCWPISNLLSSRTSQDLSAKLFFSQLVPSLHPLHGIILPRGWTFAFLFVECKIHVCSFFPACWGPFKWQHNHLIHQEHLLISKLLTVHSLPSSQSWMRVLNSTGPNIDPWDTPLITGVQPGFVPLITTIWAR